jgi:catechol 2,3-dioxygenase-like lactoylglutathione lyase family enzyme
LNGEDRNHEDFPGRAASPPPMVLSTRAQEPEGTLTMHVNALDHINVITPDLDGTARFYCELLGLERRNGPPPLTPRNAQWMYDAAGRAIVHINHTECPRFFEREVRPGPTGALHHVALNCTGYDEMIARLKSRGLEHSVNTVTAIGLRQVFTLDPNSVLLELNFFAD